MKSSIAKRFIAILLSASMLVALAPTALAENQAPAEQDAPVNAVAEAETESGDKDRDLIELANSLSNGTHTYYPTDRQSVNIDNKTMSLNYGLLADSDEMYVKSLSNTKGQAYINNTFDVFVKTDSGNKYYASESIIGASVNIYRYGYYYYENRIEGQTFLTDILPDPKHTYNVDLSVPSHQNSISQYVTNSDGSAYFVASTPSNDVFVGYRTEEKGAYLNASNYDFVEIKAKAGSASAGGQLFIVAGDATTYTAEQSSSFTFKSDGEWHTYRLPLTDISGYSGELKYIRFDIEAESGSKVDVEYVKVFKALNHGLDPTLSIQRSFLTYSDKLHHLTQFSTTEAMNGISEVGMETKIAAETVSGIVVKDADGFKYTLDGVDWATAEYVGFDIANAGVFGYILPADDLSGSMTVTVEGGYYVITQALAVSGFTPSEKGKQNANDLFFGQRIYTDENHDFTAFIREAECERNPLTKDNIIVDFSEEGSAFVCYDALRGYYQFSIGGTSFNPAYYEHPNRHYNVRFTVKGDDLDRKIYVMSRCADSGCLESAVLLNDMNMLLPIPMEVAKNFLGDGENTVYNLDDAQYGETYFPVIVNSGEKRTYNLINLYQNWGNVPLSQISSIQFHTPYYHLSTGVTETNCITLFPVCGPGLPDHRAMSAPHWTGQPQHNSGGGHSFIRYTDAEGVYASSQNSTAVIDSYGPTYCDIIYGVETSDGRVSATYTHTEMPQTDENRAYYEMKYTFNSDISFSDFAHNFIFYRVTDNNGTGTYKKVGYLDKDNNCQVADAVSTSGATREYVLGDNCPYFSFFMMPDWNRESESAQGYTNLAMLFKDWTVISNGEEISTKLLLINTKDYLTLTMDIDEITFKAGDSITINAILMPWGSQQMEDDPANRLENAQTAIYNSPHYSDVLPDGTLYMDKNVRDVRENTLLNALTPTAFENAEVIESAFVPRVKSTNGKSATFTLEGGYDNNTVRVYGFDKLTVPYIEELVGGEWVEYSVSSRNTPDALGYAHDYDGYMVHYDADGSYSYSFVFNMTDVESRTFRITAADDFNGWAYSPDDVRETDMNVVVNAQTLYNKAGSNYFDDKKLGDDNSYVTLYPKDTAGETYIVAYSGTSPTGKYIVYKYRIPTTNTSSTGTLQFWTSTLKTGASDGDSSIDIQNSALKADGQWHVLVVDVTKLKDAKCVFDQDEFGAYCARYLRIDPTNAKMTDGDSIDIGYLGFSDSIAEIIAANRDMANIELVNQDKKSVTEISTENYTADGNVTLITLESASVHKTREVTLSLKVVNNSGLSFVRVIPKYDSDVFTLKKVINGNMISYMSELDGSFIWMHDVNETGDGTLANFVFEINRDAAFGSYDIELILVDAFGKNASSFSAAATSSRLNIIEYGYGDSSGDGLISASDVVKLRRYLANYDFENGTPTVPVCDGADVNGDGYIDSNDLTTLRKYLAYYDYGNGTSSIPLGREE